VRPHVTCMDSGLQGGVDSMPRSPPRAPTSNPEARSLELPMQQGEDESNSPTAQIRWPQTVEGEFVGSVPGLQSSRLKVKVPGNDGPQVIVTDQDAPAFWEESPPPRFEDSFHLSRSVENLAIQLSECVAAHSPPLMAFDLALLNPPPFFPTGPA
jgi:hypothetical protein